MEVRSDVTSRRGNLPDDRPWGDRRSRPLGAIPPAASNSMSDGPWPIEATTRSVRSARPCACWGLHATPRQVVAELARHGVEVGEDQVERVRIDLLRSPVEIRRQRDEARRSRHPRNFRRPPKRPGRG